MSKKTRVRVRTCNCTDFWMPEGIVRTLLIQSRPDLAGMNTKPCDHWEETWIIPFDKQSLWKLPEAKV